MARKIKNDQASPGMQQLSLFELIKEQQTKASGQDVLEAGSMNISLQLRNELSKGLKHCHFSRYEVAARMSELVGAEITKSQLDSWTAESKEYHRFPAEYLPAFIQVTGYKQPLKIMADLVQCYLMQSEDALLSELGRIDHLKKELSQKEKAVTDLLGMIKSGGLS